MVLVWGGMASADHDSIWKPEYCLKDSCNNHPEEHNHTMFYRVFEDQAAYFKRKYGIDICKGTDEVQRYID